MRIEVRKQESETYAEARGIARGLGDRHLRAPHHTVSQAGLIGELCIAAGGVLLLDEVEEFRESALRALKSHLNFMHEDVRPVLVLTSPDGLLRASVLRLFDLEERPGLAREPGLRSLAEGA